MNFMDLEKLIIDLCAAGNFDQAEVEKKNAIPFLKCCLQSGENDGEKTLELFAQLAGEAESFENFSNLLDELVAEGFISKSRAEDFLKLCPANRWL